MLIQWEAVKYDLGPSVGKQLCYIVCGKQFPDVFKNEGFCPFCNIFLKACHIKWSIEQCLLAYDSHQIGQLI